MGSLQTHIPRWWAAAVHGGCFLVGAVGKGGEPWEAVGNYQSTFRIRLDARGKRLETIGSWLETAGTPTL
eukprot:7596911-Alexandrium_andersonii.AAC.1